MLIVMLTGLVMPGYSSLTQHMSELGTLDHPVASVLHVGAIISGASVVLFGIGLLLHKSKSFGFTALAAIIFGVAYVSGGIFHSGPLHGLYGLTMFYALVPACFAAELPSAHRTRFLVKISLLAAFLQLSYMCLMFSGFEPHAIRGLTQRAAALVIFGWYSVAGFNLLRSHVATSDILRNGSATAHAEG
ncbi:MAG: hypothetical protein C0516_15760 [Gemmatimonas sp.]|nr:hypothetical protein [Gemmatimonas sp.]